MNVRIYSLVRLYFESLVLHLTSTCEGTREMAAGKTEGSPRRSDRPAMDSVAIESTFTVDREKVCACIKYMTTLNNAHLVEHCIKTTILYHLNESGINYEKLMHLTS